MKAETEKHIAAIKAKIQDVANFPEAGVVFRDITPVLSDGQLFRDTILLFAERYRDKNIHKIAAVDARGFILGGALAHELGAGFTPIRKKGKLPRETFAESYQLEYGTNTLEIHADSFHEGNRTILFDDVLATGGTAAAAASLVQKAGGELIEISFFIELANLHGRTKLTDFPVYSAIVFDQ